MSIGMGFAPKMQSLFGDFSSIWMLLLFFMTLCFSFARTYHRQLDNVQGGFSALIYAAESGHKEVVEVLLSRGADVDLQSEVCIF